MPSTPFPCGPGFVMGDYTLGEALASVGPGWAGVVERLWRLCKAQDPPVAVHQVKEKFGILRFYIGYAPTEIHDAVAAGEGETARLCEDCGAPGRGRGGGWVRTLCDRCVALREAEARRPR